MTKKKDIENEEELEEIGEEQEEEHEAEDENLEETVIENKEELEELNSRLIRLQADFTNYKRRAEKEKDSLVNYGIETIVCEILPVLDNFERAMESETDKNTGFYEGIKMIQEQLIGVLNKNGVEEIKALHESFDPNYHYAVVTEESDDWEEGVILEVLQKGYILDDKVIRPTMVKVAQ